MRTPINDGLAQSDLDAAGFKILEADLSDYAGVNMSWNAGTGQFDASGGGGGGGGSSVGIDPTQAPYYASGSSTTTTTTGTNSSGATTINVASSSTFSENQGIFIAGAGAAGANYIGTVLSVPSGTSVQVTPAISTTVSAGAKVQHDDTAAWQAAITALAVTGGTIRDSSPGGFYRINGPLQDTGGANCRLKMPNIGASTGTPIGITIEGANVPGVAFDSTGIPARVSNQGTILQSDGIGGSIIGGYFNDGVYPSPFTNVLLTLCNVLFRTYDNPNQTAINLGSILQCNLINVVVDSGTNSDVISQPTHSNAYAIITPGNNNRSMCTMQNVAITGYYVGVQWNEHSEIIHLLMTQCMVGVELGFAYHALYGSRIGIFECPTSIKATSTATVYISELDLEWTAVAVWNTKVWDIDDPGHWLTGVINWHSVQAYVGIVHSLTNSGAGNLSLNELSTGNGNRPGNVTFNGAVYIGTDARFTPVSGGVKLEARNTGTGTWIEAARWTNP